MALSNEHESQMMASRSVVPRFIKLSFQVADRDGQTPPNESIRYSWSGTRGDPLMREFNGTQSVVADNVESFSLSYDKRAEALPVTSQESLETLLVYSDGTNSTIGVDLGSTTWVAQSFLPVLDDEAIGWRLTRVRFLARQNGTANGTTRVQIQRANQGIPNQQILSEVTMSESALGSSYSWQSFSFSNLPACGPSESLCLVLAHGTNSPPATVQVWGATTGNMKLASSSNSGQRWNSANALLRLYVYGTVLTPAATTYQYRLTNIRCSLSLRGKTVLRRDPNFRVLNEPVVPGP